MGQFDNKVVIITGAGAGIGRATALAFAKEGAFVTVADIDEEGIADTCKAIGDKSLGLSVDVSDADACQRMVDKTIEKFGKLDVIFNNAAITGKRGRAANLSLTEWKKVIDVNLSGVFYGTCSAIKFMENNGGGVIINTTSVDGLQGMASVTPYVAAKHGVVGITKNIALEYGHKNIRCVAIAPGFVSTAMANESFTAEEQVALGGAIPVCRGAEPEEIANLVVWLASENASYITGTTVTIDGGLTAGILATNID